MFFSTKIFDPKGPPFGFFSKIFKIFPKFLKVMEIALLWGF